MVEVSESYIYNLRVKYTRQGPSCVMCPEANEVRERVLINTDVRARETLQKEVA
jgi:hypothetical protein